MFKKYLQRIIDVYRQAETQNYRTWEYAVSRVLPKAKDENFDVLEKINEHLEEIDPEGYLTHLVNAEMTIEEHVREDRYGAIESIETMRYHLTAYGYFSYMYFNSRLLPSFGVVIVEIDHDSISMGKPISLTQEDQYERD